MERLGARLKTLSGRGLKWTVQDASAPGEGEQKIMEYLRGHSGNKDYVIYGLDADLIVLSLLHQQRCPDAKVWLFRENIEFGEMVCNSLGEETYVYMDIGVLQKYLEDQLCGSSRGSGSDAILNYAMAMCFLGNDFLPHGLSQKMSDEGHAVMMEILKAALAEGKPLLVDGQWDLEGIRYFVRQLAKTERGDIERSLRKKMSHQPKITEETHPDFYPAPKVEHDFFDGDRGPMKWRWQRIYYENYIGGAHKLAARAAARHYFEGLHWIRAYYFGEPCSNEWYYPFFLPPLWSDLLTYLDSLFATSLEAARDQTIAKPKPQEQLAIVLPVESYWLIRDPALKQLPYKAPQYWPIEYSLFSCGKKWMWECETQIPLLTLRSLRRFIA